MCDKWVPENTMFVMKKDIQCQFRYVWKDVVAELWSAHRPKMVSAMDKIQPGMGQSLEEETRTSGKVLGEVGANQAGLWLRKRTQLPNGQKGCWSYAVACYVLADILSLGV